MTITFDPYDPQHLYDGVPFDHLARVRREQPVCPTPRGAWYLSRFDLVEGALKDIDTFRADLSAYSGLNGVEAVPKEQLFLSELQEPTHGEVRRLYNATFGSYRVNKLEPLIRQMCHELVDTMVQADIADLHRDYAMVIPGLVMTHIMGLPEDTPAKFSEWSEDGTILKRPCSPDVGPGNHGLQNLFADQLAQRRALPEMPNDVFRTLSEARIDGELLTDEQIVTQLHFMVQAGVHTTRGLLTHVVERLLLDRSVFEQLRANRDLVANFIEESLRHDSPVQRTSRRCTHDIEVGGVSLAEGDWVEMGIASANRDEDKYEDPESFRLDRPQPRAHLTFGAGSHVCPGATLARLEAVIAVEVLLERVQRLETIESVHYPPIPGNLGHDPIPARVIAAN
ncbi:MAG TPA: cytochrome P450 [Acidimicrobiales bacterium]|nr:cytochrome P450 [Acidimicrobiales bacterium]